MFGVSPHDGGVIRDGGYVLELLLKCCVQSVCIESVFHCEHYTICLSIPCWKLFGGFLNVYSSFSTCKLPLGGLGYFFACTAILGILGAVNVFVTVIEKKL